MGSSTYTAIPPLSCCRPTGRSVARSGGTDVRAHGPATRFERGTGDVRMLAQLTPDAEARIEDTAIALFR